MSVGLDVVEVDAGARPQARVRQRLVQRDVGVAQLHVLADHGDVDRAVRDWPWRPPPAATRRGRPAAPIRPSFSHDDGVERLLVQQQRDLVDVVGVHGRDHRALLDVGEQRDLAALLRRQRIAGSGTAARPAGCRCERSSLTECCVGLVLISPEVAMTAPASGACTRRCCGRARRPSGGSPRGTAATRCRRPCRRSPPCRRRRRPRRGGCCA